MGTGILFGSATWTPPPAPPPRFCVYKSCVQVMHMDYGVDTSMLKDDKHTPKKYKSLVLMHQPLVHAHSIRTTFVHMKSGLDKQIRDR